MKDVWSDLKEVAARGVLAVVVIYGLRLLLLGHL